MNADYDSAVRHLSSFVILKKLSWAMGAVATIVGVALTLAGNPFAYIAYPILSLLLVLGCVFSNAAGHFSNVLSIIELKKRMSELEAGSRKKHF